jgi:hypothetical protein
MPELEGINKQPNKALHPTAYAPFVPHFASAAGELGRCAAALAEWSRGGSTLVADTWSRWMRVLA